MISIFRDVFLEQVEPQSLSLFRFSCQHFILFCILDICSALCEILVYYCLSLQVLTDILIQIVEWSLGFGNGHYLFLNQGQQFGHKKCSIETNYVEIKLLLAIKQDWHYSSFVLTSNKLNLQQLLKIKHPNTLNIGWQITISKLQVVEQFSILVNALILEDNLLEQIINQLMNCLAFNPNLKIVEEWRQIYFTESIMDSFETIIDKTHMYLEVIKNYKRKKQKQKRKLLRSRPSLCEDINQDPTVAQVQDITHEAYAKIIEEWINGINILKAKLAEETGKQQLSKKSFSGKNSQQKDQIPNRNELDSKLSICEINLQQITVQSIRFYNNFLSQEFRIIQDFIRMKIAQIEVKYGKMQRYLKSVNLKDIDPTTIRTIYQNIYIQSQYVRKVIEQTKNTFKRHSSEKQYSSEYYQINEVREKYTTKIDAMQESILQIKQNLRLVYFQYFKRKKTMKIRDHNKLQKIICDQIAVNKSEYEQTTRSANFINGLITSFLFCMLVAIIIFRQVNLNTLESDANYLKDFKIWRGASYLIYFNWIMGIVLFFFQKYKINYRMILIEEDTFIPKYTTFLLTASILSAIYLTLFLIYVLYKLNIISNHAEIENMGYYMWIINIVFLLNPFKVLNYEGRRYFLKLIYKFIMTLFIPMNMNIFFVAIIIGSFVQPFSDFAFTVCKAAYSWESNQRDCLLQTKNATFIFTLTYLFYRCVQSIRSHIQFGDKCYSRPLIGITAVLFAANTVLSSYFYNIQLSNQLLAYWLASASMSTIAGIQADLRADWGFISFDKEDWILRKYKLFERRTYFIVTVIDIILNVGWILTISNDLSSNIGLSPVYFLMILAYIELARKGMWIFFRIEDDHSANIGNLKALIDDNHLYAQIEPQDPKIHEFKFHEMSNSKINSLDFAQIKISITTGKKQQNILVQNQNLEKAKQVKKLSQIQQMIINKKASIVSLNLLINELEDYLNVIHQIYQQFQWEDQY